MTGKRHSTADLSGKAPGRLLAGSPGLSLLEVTISLGLISLFLFGLLTFYSLGVRAYHQSSLQAEAQQNLRAALFHVDRSLRAVESYTISPSGNVIEFYYAGSPTRYTYRVRYGELEYLVGTTVTKVASYIDSLSFTPTPGGVILIRIEASARGRDFSVLTGVKPRNIP